MSKQGISMIVGLGNPGPKYDQTRHNAGFWFVDELAHRAGGVFKPESKFSGDVCKINVDGKPLWLLKPMTFMNRSGLAVRQLSSFYKIPLSSILVAHDELDLPPGAAKFKLAGGHGGHNGLRDIFSHMGKDFWRLRLGVGHPGNRDEVVDFVLNRPSRDEEIEIVNSIDYAADQVSLLQSGEFDKAMNQLHGRG